MKYKVTEDIGIDEWDADTDVTSFRTSIPAGTIINLEPVEEVKVKAFVPKKGEEYFFLDDGFNICDEEHDGGYLYGLYGLQFHTKEDAQIAQAKVIELFNSFK